MKAILLAGGRGTRLRPLTHTENKHLLPIGNEPMIFRAVRDLLDAGIEDIIVNVNKGDKSIREALESQKWGAKFRFVEQAQPNGMMYPILLAEKLLAGEDFVLYAGDNILAGGLKKHIEKFEKTECDALILVTKVKNPERFSVYEVEGDVATSVVEKPKEYVGELAGTAIYFYKGGKIFEAMKNAKPIDPEGKGKPEYFPPVAHQWMIEHGGKVVVSEITGWWKDTGKASDLLLANRMVLEKKSLKYDDNALENSEIEGEVEIMKGSKVMGSKIRGPVSIGKNVVIKNSFIGPFTSIGDGSVIDGAHVENSILMGENRVVDVDVDVRLDSSLMGYRAEVTSVDELPKASQFFIGDDSVVKL